MIEKYNKKTQHTGYLYFSNGKKIQTTCYGEYGIFTGFLTFIDGDFSLLELQYNNNFDTQKQIFYYNNVITTTGFKNCKNTNQSNKLVILTDFVTLDFDEDIIKNITIATDIKPKHIENIFAENNIIDKQYIKCCLVFQQDYKTFNEEEVLKELNKMPNYLFDYNFLEDLSYKKPFRLYKTGEINDNKIQQLPIYNSKKTIGLYDFGISTQLLNILQTYWNVIVFPYNNTFKRTDYIKLDGIIISNSITNCSFVKETIKTEILQLLQSDIPVLGIDFGAILMCDVLNIKTTINRKFEMINNCIIRDNHKKHFVVSSAYFYKIEDVISKNNIETMFYDNKNCVVGMQYKNNLIYNFTFNKNTLDTAKLLNIFDNLMKQNKRIYKWK